LYSFELGQFLTRRSASAATNIHAKQSHNVITRKGLDVPRRFLKSPMRN
jgi:hypothetical protein